MGESKTTSKASANPQNSVRVAAMRDASEKIREKQMLDKLDVPGIFKEWGEWHEWNTPYRYRVEVVDGKKEDIGKYEDTVTTGAQSDVFRNIWEKLGYGASIDDKLKLRYRYVEDMQGNIVAKGE